MEIKAFYDPATFTVTFVVWDAESKDAVVIDPVLDYDPLASQTGTARADEVTDFVRAAGLAVHYVLETHAHADHLSSSQLLKRRFEAKVGVGSQITAVQQTFKSIFDFGDAFATDGSQFDKLFEDGEVVHAGRLRIEVHHTPGHTPACVTYKIGDALFVGDVLFMDDYGTGRCDFPKGSAEAMYESLRKLYAFPDDTRVFVGHDYQPNGREVKWETTIGKSKRNNPHMRAETTQQEFVKLRTERDATLRPPRLIFQSVQVNANAGCLPKPHENGIRYLATPLNLFGPTDDLGVPLK